VHTSLSPKVKRNLTSRVDVKQATKGLEVVKTPEQDYIPNRLQRHRPKTAITLLKNVFNAAVRKQNFPLAWKNARVISIVKPRKYPTLPSSYRPISVLDTVSKLFEEIPLSRVLREVNERRLLRDEQSGTQHTLNTTLQLARLVGSQHKFARR
jgi:hypothetical protein